MLSFWRPKTVVGRFPLPLELRAGIPVQLPASVAHHHYFDHVAVPCAIGGVALSV
jgi:hypothetical protein